MKTTIRLKQFLCDVLIIGNGSAGLRAAIEGHDRGANVLIVSKSERDNPHTILATGGINAALGTMDPKDNWKIHAADTLREGKFLADYENVVTMCKNASRAIKELIEWGARFQREPDGRLTQRFFGAHSYRRTCFHGDETGKEIIRVLMNQVHKRKIRVIDGVYITKLLDLNGKINGAAGIDFKRKRLVAFMSKCVILAGGGYSHVYAVSSSRDFENYGEGVTLAYEVGADLIDMEMIQFHPTGMVWPKRALGTLATESIRGEGGILLNSRGERFMKNYNPQKMELGPRDEVARTIYNEIMSGRGTKHGAVWLDVTHIPKQKILTRLPRMYKQFRNLAGIDISKQKMEVAPTAHYSMGGVKVDTKGRTKVKGLFAVGEVTGQFHGANRLGGNSLLETIVFGRIAGREAALYSKQKQKKLTPSLINSDEIIDSITDKLFVFNDAVTIRDKIQKLMQNDAGIIREAGKLQSALQEVLEMKKKLLSEREERAKNKKVVMRSSAKIGKHMVETLEVESALIICQAIIRSALMRQESRGAHYRSDFPKQDDKKWMVNIYCVKNDKGVMALVTKKVTRGPLRLLPKKIQVQHHLLE